MRIVFLIIFIMCAIDAFAAEADNDFHPSVAAGVGLLAEKASNGRTYEARTLGALRLGGDIGQNEFLVEAAGFKQLTGTSGIEISRFHQQVDFWYHFLFWSQAEIGHPFIGAALGVQRDEITTTFFNQSTKDTGQFETQLSLSAGFRFDFATALSIWLEGRLSTSANYEPKVLPSAVAALGVRI